MDTWTRCRIHAQHSVCTTFLCSVRGRHRHASCACVCVCSLEQHPIESSLKQPVIVPERHIGVLETERTDEARGASGHTQPGSTWTRTSTRAHAHAHVHPHARVHSHHSPHRTDRRSQDYGQRHSTEEINTSTHITTTRQQQQSTRQNTSSHQAKHGAARTSRGKPCDSNLNTAHAMMSAHHPMSMCAAPVVCFPTPRAWCC